MIYSLIGNAAANAFWTVWNISPFIYIGVFVAWLFLQTCRWRVYIKMGEPGWVGLIPIWRIFILLFRAWSDWAPTYFFLPLLIGGAFLFFDNLIAVIIGSMLWGICCEVYLVGLIKLAKGTGHSAGFGVGLLLLPFIFYPWLAFTN